MKTPDASPPGGAAQRIALVGPAFFGYLARLAAEMRRQGMAAEAFDELPSNRVTAKMALRLMPASARALALRQHHAALLKRLLSGGFARVLLVSVESLPQSFVDRLRAAGVTVVLYAWDSLANKPQTARLARRLDRVASFDPVDCAATGMTCVPLFSLAPGGTGHPPTEVSREIDFLFCGTLHSDRARWLARLWRIARAEGHSLRVMAYAPARPLWLARHALRPGDWPMVGALSTRPFAPAEVYAAMAAARVVIDLPHPRQTGLTMRCFEAWSQGAVVLSRGGAAAGLDDGLAATARQALAARLVRFEGSSGTELAAVLQRALEAPTGRLPAAAAEAVSTARFIAEIRALFD